MRTMPSDTNGAKPSSKRRLIAIGAGFMLLNAAVFGLLFAAATQRDLDKTMGFAQETVSFLENTCEKYDNYNQGKLANALQDLDDAVGTFSTFLPEDQVSVDDELLEEYVRAERLSGLVVLDADGNMTAHYDADGRDPLFLWSDVLSCSSVKGIYRGGTGEYSDVLERRGLRFAVNASSYGDGVVFAYRAIESGNDDRYEYGIDGLLADNTFHENPTVALVEDGDVVSTNRPGEKKSLRRLLVGDKVDWQEGALTQVRYDGGVWYAVRSAYKDYTLYVLYPKSEVMSGRFGFIAGGLLIYLLAAVLILVVRGYNDRRNLRETQKQLDIIDAISSTYVSTFILHLNTLTMEGIHMSPCMADVFARHPEPHEFLENVIRDAVMPEYHEIVHRFMDPETLVDRLEGKPFIAVDIRGADGLWYSLQVIPQHHADDGSLTSVVVATRDVTVVKEAEELSFRDKLTGLRNRNYLESHIDEFLSPGTLPVSIVMADCNYLKRTNDELGHEMGDELLRRMASVLTDVAGDARLPMRIGGDEFLLVCPHTDEQTAHMVIAAARFGLEEASDAELSVSASFGCVTVTEPGADFGEMFKAADRAMYREKRAMHGLDGRE